MVYNMQLSNILPAPFYNLGSYYLELRELKKSLHPDQEKMDKTALKVFFTARDCFHALLNIAVMACVSAPFAIGFVAITGLYNPTGPTAGLASISRFGSLVIAIIAVASSSFELLGLSLGVFAFSLLSNAWYRNEVQKMWIQLEKKPIKEPNSLIPLTKLEQTKYELKGVTSKIIAWA